MTCPPKHDVRRWKIRDWRGADAGLVRVCYDAERRHWAGELGWDTSWTWSTVEHARTTWGLPGLIALADGERPLGWTFYTVDGTRLSVGALVALDETVTGAFLDRILAAAPDAIDSASCFVLDRAPGLASALATRGFAIERFHYLSRPLSSVASGVSRPAAPADVAGFASLLHAAYTPDRARHFAAGGSLDEWTRYVDGLIRQRGCGTFDASATCMRADEGGVQAAALVTSVSATTADLAQLAVRPDCRGRGLARNLLEEASARAAQAGKSEMTLLVGDGNAPARHLYERLGFRPRALFIAADRRTSSRRSAGAFDS